MKSSLSEALDRGLLKLAGQWTTLSALGGFAVYLCGYLTLRFRLMSLGISVDLGVLDEKYLFSGAQFLLHAMWSLSSILLVACLAAIAAFLPAFFLLVAWTALFSGRAFISRLRARWDFFAALWNKGLRMAWRPIPLSYLATALSLFIIQFVMRKPLDLRNLLLGSEIVPPWPLTRAILVGGGWQELYFCLVLCGLAVPLAVFIGATADLAARPKLKTVFAFVLVVQAFLVPVNYGILVQNRYAPRVASIDAAAAAPGERTWLIWEGDATRTFLVRRPMGAENPATLITLEKSAHPKIEISGFELLLQALRPDSSRE